MRLLDVAEQSFPRALLRADECSSCLYQVKSIQEPSQAGLGEHSSSRIVQITMLLISSHLAISESQRYTCSNVALSGPNRQLNPAVSVCSRTAITAKTGRVRHRP